MGKIFRSKYLTRKTTYQSHKGRGFFAEKPHKGQDREGMKRWRPSPINQTISQPSDKNIEARITNHTNSTAPMHSVNNANEGMTHARPLIPDVPLYPGPTYRYQPKPIRFQMPGSHEGSQSSK